jgi:hypothetical protein
MTLDEVSAYQSAVHEVRRRQRSSRILLIAWLTMLAAIGGLLLL